MCRGLVLGRETVPLGDRGVPRRKTGDENGSITCVRTWTRELQIHDLKRRRPLCNIGLVLFPCEQLQ